MRICRKGRRKLWQRHAVRLAAALDLGRLVAVAGVAMSEASPFATAPAPRAAFLVQGYRVITA